MNPKKILLIGSSNMDLVLNMYRLPEAGQTVTDDGGVAYLPGGKGANAAVAFAKLGVPCVFCTKVGADLHGQKLFEYYKSVGLDTTLVTVDRERPTGLAALLRENDGQTRTIAYPGANAGLTPDLAVHAFACQPDALYLNFEIPFDTVLAAARSAAQRGIPVFIDAAPADRECALETLPPAEIFSPNESETETYTGIRPAGANSCLQAALAMYRRVKCHYLVLKLGARGAFIYDGKHYNMVPAFRVDKVVDPAAAGDAFTAAMTFAYLQTGDIKQAVEAGNAAGALTVGRRGASVSVPTAAEIGELLERNRL